jgi:hypothetical protein
MLEVILSIHNKYTHTKVMSIILYNSAYVFNFWMVAVLKLLNMLW